MRPKEAVTMKLSQTMRFKRVDDKGMWVNFATYTRKDRDGPSVSLVPMLHVAEELFLEEAEAEIWCHDVVLLESGNVPQIRWLKGVYELFARVQRLGRQSSRFNCEEQLASSNDATSDWSKPTPNRPSEIATRIDESARGFPVSPRTIRFIKADIDRKASKHALREIPWWFWVCVPLAIIVELPQILFKLKRRDIIEMLMDGSPPKFGLGRIDRNVERFLDFVIRQRDQNLYKILEAEIRRAESASISICVQFGAGHMPALDTALIEKLGYSISSERWVLCMREDKSLAIDELDCFAISKQRYRTRLGPHISEIRKKTANKPGRSASVR